jgi:Abnormal spindle-like microcephaly-assoc'd, ASPM-SPD-2-Hydin
VESTTEVTSKNAQFPGTHPCPIPKKFHEEKSMVRVGTVVRTLILCGLALTTLAFAKTDKSKTIVTYPSAFGVSQRLTDLPIDESMFATREMPEPRAVPLRKNAVAGPVGQEDPILQKEVLPEVSATQGIPFEGISTTQYVPSDSNLAVGPNHIVETVNVQYAVYNKSGAILAGPTNITTLFGSLGGNCAANGSDPIVNYDRLADRWVISDVGINSLFTAFSECVAVSKTNDPSGAYFLYAYSFGGNLNDYPKLSVWPTASNSAYLATYNIFQGPALVNFLGADICAFDRTKMLAGTASAAQLCKMTSNSEGGYLPSDIDGSTAPVDGTPGLYLTWQNNNPGQLYLRKLTLNFATATATLSAPTTISVANENLACGNGFSSCVPQLGTAQTLDPLGDRLMYRFAIRHFADHDRAVVNHAVANGSQVAVRWYELYDPAGSVTVNQQGTFAPDTTFRWMASMAEDKNGDIGLGYSASSGSIHPTIRFTGRVPSDAVGTMETEASILEGTGSQSGSQYANRWGDYTAMQVDPSDDCTFWYVDQYEKVSGVFNWHTSISSFAFNGCSGGGGPAVTLTPTALTFGNVVVNTTSTGKNVTVTNSGNATLNIASVTASGDFALVASTKPCGSTLAAGKNCVIRVTFSPSQLGTRTGNITITDDASNSPQKVPLSGKGVPPAALTPGSATYTARTVGTTSLAKVFYLKNYQTVALNSIVISTTGDFSVSATTCATSLAAKTNCTISVVFKPTLVGTRTGKVNVADNASNSPQASSLTGAGK